jgi:hypothetical protein
VGQVSQRRVVESTKVLTILEVMRTQAAGELRSARPLPATSLTRAPVPAPQVSTVANVRLVAGICLIIVCNLVAVGLFFGMTALLELMNLFASGPPPCPTNP